MVTKTKRPAGSRYPCLDRVLAGFIQSGREFTSGDLQDAVEELPFAAPQLGNYMNSWRGRGAIRKTGKVVPRRTSSSGGTRHVYVGVKVSEAVRYQVMPPLSAEEYQDLYESIKSEGVHEAVHVDADGVIIDGHHRSKIAKELGIPFPIVTHDDLDEAGKRSLAFTLNLKRRHLNREQRNALVVESLKLDPLARDSEHSKRTGMDRKTVKRIREDAGIPQPVEVIAEYVEAHPEKNDYQISQDLGVFNHTVKSARPDWQKRDIPENANISPSTGLISSTDLDALNNPLPTEQPTMEQPPKEEAEPMKYKRIGTKNQKKQLQAAERLTGQLDAITGALDHFFPLFTFEKTFTEENAAELATALQRSIRKLEIHKNRLEDFTQGE